MVKLLKFRNIKIWWYWLMKINAKFHSPLLNSEWVQYIYNSKQRMLKISHVNSSIKPSKADRNTPVIRLSDQDFLNDSRLDFWMKKLLLFIRFFEDKLSYRDVSDVSKTFTEEYSQIWQVSKITNFLKSPFFEWQCFPQNNIFEWIKLYL